jgi:hypothetical protein
MRRRQRGLPGTLALGNGRVDNDCHWSGGSAGVRFLRSGIGNNRISPSVHEDEAPPAFQPLRRSDDSVAEGGVDRRKVGAPRCEIVCSQGVGNLLQNFN